MREIPPDPGQLYDDMKAHYGSTRAMEAAMKGSEGERVIRAMVASGEWLKNSEGAHLLAEIDRLREGRCPTCNASEAEPCAYPTENAKRLQAKLNRLRERVGVLEGALEEIRYHEGCDECGCSRYSAAPEPQEAESTMEDVPRRIRRDQWTPAERAIGEAVEAVEDLPADERLTNAVVLLGEAKDAVADYVDGIHRTSEPTEGGEDR